MISREEVEKIAKLVRLKLKEREIEKMQKDLSSILDYFDLLKTAKASKEKSEKILKENVLRRDKTIIYDSDTPENLIKAAPESKDGYIKVKAIL